MKLQLVEEWAEIRKRANDWNALLDGARPEDPFLTFEWYESLREAFGRGCPTPTLFAYDSAGLLAVWPLHPDRTRLGKVIPCRQLLDSGGWFVPHNGLVCRGDPAACAREMLRYVRARLRGWDALVVANLIEGGATHAALREACGELRLSTDTVAGKRSPYLSLQGSWETCLKERSGNFRSALRRNEKALKAMGTVSIEFLRSPEEVRRGLADVLAIEQRSWKHRAGSAITSRPWEQAFYEAYLPRAAKRNIAELAVMRLDGRPIAYYMGLIYGNRYSLLKVSYVDDLKAGAPGKVICRHVVQSHFERGLIEHDFLGEDERWKLDWTPAFRPHVNLTIYRSDLYGRMVRTIRWLRTRRNEVAQTSAPETP
ncbi:MAG TPA: GNAT family N-acetyltransferase [Phycisphaerae bacterium]|nr:GNAT family N-acetyltransferase [Phycisphaerae bacterium]